MVVWKGARNLRLKHNDVGCFGDSLSVLAANEGAKIGALVIRPKLTA
jgi:hypothetical protein